MCEPAYAMPLEACVHNWCTLTSADILSDKTSHRAECRSKDNEVQSIHSEVITVGGCKEWRSSIYRSRYENYIQPWLVDFQIVPGAL